MKYVLLALLLAGCGDAGFVPCPPAGVEKPAPAECPRPVVTK